MYLSYDLTETVHDGENVFGVILGNGFYDVVKHWSPMGYGTPRFMGQIEITYKDGTSETIASDEEIIKSDDRRISLIIISNKISKMYFSLSLSII